MNENGRRKCTSVCLRLNVRVPFFINLPRKDTRWSLSAVDNFAKCQRSRSPAASLVAEGQSHDLHSEERTFVFINVGLRRGDIGICEPLRWLQFNPCRYQASTGNVAFPPPTPRRLHTPHLVTLFIIFRTESGSLAHKPPSPPSDRWETKQQRDSE